MIWLNIRVGSWHLQGGRIFPYLSFYKNPGHTETRQWWPPKFSKGEFRSQQGWRYFAVHNLFGVKL